MAKQKSSLIYQAKNIRTLAEIASTVVRLRNLFHDRGWAQPALPQNILTVVPCVLCITEVATKRDIRNARIMITDPEGNTLFDYVWAFASALT
jgi:hypothetical protein